MKKIGSMFFLYDTCDVYVSEYRSGGIAIMLIEPDSGEQYAVASAWIPGLREGEIAIKDYSENEGMLEALLSHGITNPPHRMLNGFPIVTLK